MNRKMTVLSVAMIVGLIALTCAVAAQKTDPVKRQGGKAAVHAARVYTVVDEAARILKDVEEEGYDLADHAATLQAGGRVGLSWESNAAELDALHDAVNGMGKNMQRLEALARNETSWERDTVKRVMPLLKQVAASTDEAIRFINAKPQQIELLEYQKITGKLYDQSTALWNALHDSVKLADLHEREARLKKALNVAGKTSD